MIGPAGKLLELLDRHPMRPAHIHLIVSFQCRSLRRGIVANKTAQVLHDDYKPLTTQIFDSRDQHLTDDSVFAVKDSLVVEFKPLKGNDQATLEVVYDVALVKREAKSTNGTAPAPVGSS